LQHHKVIIQTAEHKNEELQYLIDMGISGYLLKPFDSTNYPFFISLVEK